MLGYLDDIASDLSAFHQIRDASEMEAPVFLMLATRLPAYSGAMAARVAAEREDAPAVGGGRHLHAVGSYERGDQRTNNPRAMAGEPVASAADLMAISGLAGGSVVRVPAAAVT